MKRLFGTDGVRGKANIYPMDAETALRIGKAAAAVLLNGSKRHKIVIGKDTRISGYIIENALTAGILSMGVDVLLVGPVPTPAIAHLTKSFAADAGIMISASHNPAEDNGIKIFDSRGFKLSDEVEERIERLFFSDITTDHITGELVGKAKRIDDAQGRYIEFAKSSIDNLSLKGLKIVLDCANGAAYKITPAILQELGAEVITINAEPNGLNINANCGALFPEEMRQKVREQHADIGIALDGDADRVIMVDEQGNDVDGDQIIALCALDMIAQEKLAKNTVVVTDYSNMGLDIALSAVGGRVVRTQNGDRYVVEEMRRHQFILGGEQSGHIIFMDYSTTGDGTIAGLQVLRMMKKTAKPLSELAACMEKFPQAILNVTVKEKVPLAKLPTVMEKINKLQGILKDKGRVFVRYSGTQMVARIMVEGQDKARITTGAKEIADELKRVIG